MQSSSSSHMRVMNHNWSATKQRLHPQSVAEISRHSVLSGDRIRQCETSAQKIELNQARSKPDPVNCPVITAKTIVCHYNGTQLEALFATMRYIN